MTPLLYVERTPPPPLRRSVRCLWLLETPRDAAPPAADRVLPDGCVEFADSTPGAWLREQHDFAAAFVAS